MVRSSCLVGMLFLISSCGSSDLGQVDSGPGSGPESPAPGAGTCGNGVWEDGEICDDGNTVDGDGCTADCQAASCLVPVTHASLQAGVEDTECDVLYVYSGTYTESVRVDRERLTIEAVGAGPVIAHGGQLGRVFEIHGGEVLLRGFEIRGGQAERGAGIHAKGASLTLERMVVRDNTAAAETGAAGGGIYSEGSTLTLRRAEVLGNRVNLDGATSGSAVEPTAAGGGIYAVAPGSVTLDDRSRVADNRIELARAHGVGRGAGIFARDVLTNIAGGSAVEDNLVAVDGGAAPATAEAGGILQLRGSLHVTEGSSVAENTARARGGATAAPAGEAGHAGDRPRPSVIVRERVTVARGGGIVLIEAALVVDGQSLIDDNLAEAESTEQAESGGGGVYLADATGSDERCPRMQVADARLTRNRARAFASASNAGAASDARGGAIHARIVPSPCASIELRDSLVVSNLAEAQTASTAGGEARGGSLYGVTIGPETGALAIVIERSTFNDNTAHGNGTAEGGGAHVLARGGARVSLDIRHSTLSGNLALSRDAAARGGGLHVSAEGLGDAELSLVLSNSTMSGNAGASTHGKGHGGALYVTTVDTGRLDAAIESATIADNMASSTAGGIYVSRGHSSALAASGNEPVVSLHNTIVAVNEALKGADCDTATIELTSRGYNLIHDTGRCTITGDTTDDLYDMDPRLGALADNGGPTRTHALRRSSPAIDAGDPVSCPEVDQRGEPRTVCDIGAFERVP